MPPKISAEPTHELNAATRLWTFYMYGHIPEADFPDDDDRPPLPWLLYRLCLLNDDEDDELPMVHCHSKLPGQEFHSRYFTIFGDIIVINAFAGNRVQILDLSRTGLRRRQSKSIRDLLLNFFFSRLRGVYGDNVQLSAVAVATAAVAAVTVVGILT